MDAGLRWIMSATIRVTASAWLLSLAAIAAQAAPPDNPPQAGDQYTRVEQRYRIPDVTLRDRHDRPVKLQSLLANGRPIVLQFIFTSCQTVCPLLTAMTSQAQNRLRALDPATRIVSISLDPEYDTPKRMADYAGEFGARGDWRFLTGDWGAIRGTLTAFGAMYPAHNKMYHKPYTFIRAASSDTWVRLTGLMSATKMVAEYRRLLTDTVKQQQLAKRQTANAQEN